jgi:hypothetical protein
MGHSQPMPWAQRQSDEVIGVGSHVRVGGVGAITVVFVVNLPVRRFAREDAAGLRAELASLESMGLLTQSEVARSGLVPEATFHRDCAAFRAGGEAAVRARTVRGSRGPRKLLPAVLLEIKRLRAEGLTQAVIGQRLGMSTRTVIHALSTGEDAPTAIAPLTRPGTESAAEPAIEAVRGEGEDALAETESAVAAAQAIEAERPAADADACTRRVAQQRADEWTLARLGQIEEQSALFPPIERARFGGVLLAMALLPTTGLLEQMRVSLGGLAHGLYGIRSIVTTLIAMAMLRCKRPEQLKGFDPAGLGAVVGLARAPEMKTLRRKLKALADDEAAVVDLGRAMAKRHVERARAAVAFLYVDGHVRPYFGETTLGKAHHTASRIVLPATTDYWIHDADGAPVLVVTTEGNAALTKALPSLLAEVRKAVGPAAKPTVVFDRGGYSPKLFKQIAASGFDVLTYRKGKHPAIARREFKEIVVTRGGRDHTTLVSDRRTRLPGFGLIRCVAVLRDDDRQTHVLTTRTDLSAREVLERMFGRWQQENFFKYLRESFAFDALWTYDTIEGDASRTVPSPYRRHFAKLRKSLQRRLATLRSKRPQDAAIRQEIKAITERLRAIARCWSALPERVSIGEVRAPEPVLELARAPKLLCDLVKMTAFQIETMLVAAVGPHLRRAPHEGRAFIADVMQLDARLEPREERLDVVLAKASAPRYTQALAALCEHISALNLCFPETRVALSFRVDDQP